MRVWNGKQLYTASEMYRITGTDPKTQALRVYERDKWKLLTPTDTPGSGVRLYDDNAMMRFVIIRMFVAVGYSLEKIKDILDNPGFDIRRITDEQLHEIEVKKAELDQKAEIIKAIRKYGIEIFAKAALTGSSLDKYIVSHPIEIRETRKTEEEKIIEEERDEAFEKFLSLGTRNYDSEEVQELISELAEEFMDEEEGLDSIMEYLLISMLLLGKNENSELLDERGGPGTSEFVALIMVSAIFRSVDYRVEEMRKESECIDNELELKAFVRNKMDIIKLKADKAKWIDSEYLGRLIQGIQLTIGAEDPVDAMIFLIKNEELSLGCYDMVNNMYNYLKKTVSENGLQKK